MKGFLALLILTLFTSCSTAKNKANMAEINRLDEAATFLMLVSDEEKLTNTCGLSPQEALSMLGPLHALIDDVTDHKRYTISTKTAILCENHCHCGLYSDLAENSSDKNLLYKKAESTPKSKLITCANETSTWFCKDKLFFKLKEAREKEAPSAF